MKKINEYKKVNEGYDFECIDTIAGEILDSNDEWSLRSAVLDRKEDYTNAMVQCCGNGLYVIKRNV